MFRSSTEQASPQPYLCFRTTTTKIVSGILCIGPTLQKLSQKEMSRKPQVMRNL